MADRITQGALAVNWRNLALGHETFGDGAATFVRDRRFPNICDANFVFDVRTPKAEDIERLLDRARTEYAHATRLTFRIDPFTSPEFESRLVLDQYERSEALLLVLDGPPRGAPNRTDIRLINDDADWNDYGNLKILDWREYAAESGGDGDDTSIVEDLTLCSRLKSPPVQYAKAVGFCSVWAGTDGIGQVEGLFVHPSYRHCGIGTALLHFCIARARAEGAGPVAIVSSVTNTSKAMYAALGWQPRALCREYWRSGS
jgi:ribosomal protein S18 acetylase RimI-like enzyme